MVILHAIGHYIIHTLLANNLNLIHSLPGNVCPLAIHNQVDATKHDSRTAAGSLLPFSEDMIA